MQNRLLILVVIPALLCACGRQAGAQAELTVYNYTTDIAVWPNSMTFEEGGPDIVQSPLANISLEIAYRPAAYPGYGNVGIQFVTNSLYHCPLWYGGAIPDGTDNSLVLHFISPFPSNVLVTCLVQEEHGSQAVDLRKKLIEEGATGWLSLPLETIYSAINGMEYATNSVRFAPLRTEVTQVAVSGGTPLVTLTAATCPGAIVWPEYCERLADGFDSGTIMTNLAVYAAVAPSNFAGAVPVTWTNLPAPATNGFYRVGGSPYDDETRHLVD